MNSEELEISLKAEFEGYLNDLFAEMRQKTSDFQRNFEAEFEKHKSQMDEAIRHLAERFESAPKLEPALAQSVTEHLRLAKDAGAELAATAFDEAEKLVAESSAPVSYDKLRDAIGEISAKTSQSTILTSLIIHASEFAPRGAFFIVKNDHFVGWKRFGRENGAVDAIGDLRFPVGGESVLARAVNELRTTDAAYSEDCPERVFIDALDLGKPDRMYAIPLTARGRGVAVMYVDYGVGGTNLNIEALETLVRVAGLTVELLAASQTVQASAAGQVHVSEAAPEAIAHSESVQPENESEYRAELYEQQSESDNYSVNADDTYSIEYAEEVTPEAVSEPAEPYHVEAVTEAADEGAESVSFEPVVETGFSIAQPTVTEETGPVPAEAESTVEVSYEVAAEPEGEIASSVPEFTTGQAEASEDEVSYFEPEVVEEAEPEHPVEVSSTDYTFESDASFEAAAPVTEPEPQVAEVSYASPEPVGNGYHNEPVSAPVAEVSVEGSTTSRFSTRNIDLPIEVPEEERRFHNDARRFARLLVEEIKLYNKQKVEQGRETGDLYDCLREAIDRSREMYEKRVKPMVASKFDYFHYELVNNLAEGEERKLGASYGGAAV